MIVKRTKPIKASNKEYQKTIINFKLKYVSVMRINNYTINKQSQLLFKKNII